VRCTRSVIAAASDRAGFRIRNDSGPGPSSSFGLVLLKIAIRPLFRPSVAHPDAVFSRERAPPLSPHRLFEIFYRNDRNLFRWINPADPTFLRTPPASGQAFHPPGGTSPISGVEPESHHPGPQRPPCFSVKCRAYPASVASGEAQPASFQPAQIRSATETGRSASSPPSDVDR